MTFVSWFLWFPSVFHFLVALVSRWLSLIFHKKFISESITHRVGEDLVEDRVNVAD